LQYAPRQLGVKRTPHTPKNSPSVNSRDSDDSRCTSPVSSCVWIDWIVPAAGSIPMSVGMRSFRPWTKICTFGVLVQVVPSAGRPSAVARAADSAAFASQGARS
jgi:hypothetical protein